ncbi:hypothetical protein X975_08840, partial [Stegodyphus mimosarum]
MPFKPRLLSILREGPLPHWREFEECLADIISFAQDHLKLPPRASATAPSSTPQVATDPKSIQRLYRRNRRRAVRLIVQGDSPRCPLDCLTVYDHFTSTEPPRFTDASLFADVSPAPTEVDCHQ